MQSWAGCWVTWWPLRTMRKEYDFTKARKNPYASNLIKQITIRLDEDSIGYFKGISEQVGIPYQSLINLYLRDCAAHHRKLDLSWKWFVNELSWNSVWFFDLTPCVRLALGTVTSLSGCLTPKNARWLSWVWNARWPALTQCVGRHEKPLNFGL